MIRVAIDKNGDGFICKDAQPGDALNFIPNAVRIDKIPVDYNESVTTYTLGWEQTPYGIRKAFMLFTAADTLYVGSDLGTVDTIAVQPNTTYTIGVWLRWAGGSIGLEVVNQSLTTLASKTVTLNATWTRETLTFTTGASDTHIALGFDNPSGQTTLEAIGFMLVAGASLPSAFNSGDLRDFDEFITSDVLAIKWRRGMSSPADFVAGALEGELVLNNIDGTYSPETSSTVLAPGTQIRVYDDDDVLVTAMIKRVIPQAGDQGGRTVTLQLTGPMINTRNVLARAPLFINDKAGEMLSSLLDDDTLLRYGVSLDEGVSTFSYMGDTWSDTVQVSRAVKQIVEAERGRLFTDRGGAFVFHDRDHDYGSSAATFENAYDALDFSYGDDLINQMRVSIRPRTVGTAGTTLWTLDTAQKIEAGQRRSLLVTLRDADGVRVGAAAIINPVPTTDYTANTAADGTGTDITADLVLEDADPLSSTARLTFRNDNASDAYLQPGTRLRGTPIHRSDTIIIDRADEDSVYLHGPHLYAVTLPHFITLEDAEDFAQSTLDAHKTPQMAVHSIALSDRTRYADALAHDLFTHITVKEGHTGHDADYVIVGEAHEIDLAGLRHRVVWTLARL